MSFRIEKMKFEDTVGVSELEKICFASPWTLEGIREELDNDFSHFLVALKDDKVIGYIGVQEICGEAYITNICVLPGERRQGTARALLDCAVSGAKSRNCDFITLEVRKSNSAAIALYEKTGFKAVGCRKNFYTSPTEDALLYTLNFEKE